MIHVSVFDPTGKRLKIQFDPGESGVASLIAVAHEMRAELVERKLRHQLQRGMCNCDECSWTDVLQKRLEGYFVKGL